MAFVVLRRKVEPVVADVAADFDDRNGDRMVPVGTARERLAVGKRLLDRLRVRLGAPENAAAFVKYLNSNSTSIADLAEPGLGIARKSRLPSGTWFPPCTANPSASSPTKANIVLVLIAPPLENDKVGQT